MGRLRGKSKAWKEAAALPISHLPSRQIEQHKRHPTSSVIEKLTVQMCLPEHQNQGPILLNLPRLMQLCQRGMHSTSHGWPGMEASSRYGNFP